MAMEQLLLVGDKTCRLCGTSKPLRDFAPAKNCVDGYRRICRICRNAQELARHHRNPDLMRRRMLKHKYGLTMEDYDALLAQQGGLCAICGTNELHPRRRKHDRFALHVDHDHETGRVRGLLCYRCNNGIGLIRDPVSLRAAADYLEGR